MLNIAPRWALVCLLLPALASAQASLNPRRISKDFIGTLPLMWTLEGEGDLRTAAFRLLDEQGKELLPPQAVETRRISPGQWQAWDFCAPSAWFEKLPAGRYVFEWNLQWIRNGQPRTERTETVLRLEGQGDGWLPRCYPDSDAFNVKLATPAQWAPGRSLPLSLDVPNRPLRIRYQVIEEAKETVIRPWTELPLDQGLHWQLPWGDAWPQGRGWLWVLIEYPQGEAQVLSRDLWLGTGLDGKGGRSGAPLPPKKRSSAPPLVNKTQPFAPSQPSNPPTDWLSPWEGKAEDVLPWENTNRIATVAVGYVDEERNGARLWPSDSGRPASLSLTGADGLGSPLYSVSYLLAQSATTATGLESIASQALAVNQSTASLPQGARSLKVGNVPAPVGVSAGVLKDALGRATATGYGWAMHQNGVLLNAEDWSMHATTAPPVGLEAIRQAAVLNAKLISDAATRVGYSGNESVLLDDTRDPFGFVVTSNDGLGRPLLTKGLGSPRRTPLPVNILQEAPIHLSWDLAGAPPAWLTLDDGASVDASVNPRRILLAGSEEELEDDLGEHGQGIWVATNPGAIWVDFGVAIPGSKPRVTCHSEGNIRAEWYVDGAKVSSESWLGIGDRSTALTNLTMGGLVSLQLVDGRPTERNHDIHPVPSLIRDLVGDRDALPVAFEAANTGSSSLVPGFTSRVYGLVEIPTQGRCAVAMVTDPDGSAIAEISDPEGRVIYKIGNPDSTYLSLFKDAHNNPFPVPDPKYIGTVNPGGTIPRNVMTQHLYDAEGHCRAIIPPKGKGSDNLWGYRLDDPAVIAVFNWNGDPATLTPLPFATHTAYDQSGNPVATYNPDEGFTRIRVDQKGRAHFSQVEGQRTNPDGTARSVPTWTRTLYDQLLRVVAVGETNATLMGADPGTANTETQPIMTASNRAELLNTLDPASRGINTYDAYLADPLASDSPLDPEVKTRLPEPAIWQAYAGGHLTQTEDAHAIERYYFDQDGRTVIRWVSVKDGTGTWNHFAIGVFYDFAGRVKRLVYPAGPDGKPLQVVYTYDDLGRLFAVGTPDDPAYFARYAYQPTGAVRAIVYGPGEGFAVKRMMSDPQGWLRALSIQGK